MRLNKITDACSKCGEIFTCELCKQGHGVDTERSNVSQMIECQMKRSVENEYDKNSDQENEK